MLGEIQAAVESVKEEIQNLSRKQADMEEKFDHMIDDMSLFSREASRAWRRIHYELTGRHDWDQLFTEDASSQSGDESGWEEGGSRSGRASV